MQQVNRISGGRLDDDMFFSAICRAFHPLILTLHPAGRIATHEVQHLGLANPVEFVLAIAVTGKSARGQETSFAA